MHLFFVLFAVALVCLRLYACACVFVWMYLCRCGSVEVWVWKCGCGYAGVDEKTAAAFGWRFEEEVCNEEACLPMPAKRGEAKCAS